MAGRRPCESAARMAALTVKRAASGRSWLATRGPWRAGAPAAFLWPFGPRRRRRALNPRGRPHGLLAATSAVARGAASGAIPPAPAF
jgi:hypothetical protein